MNNPFYGFILTQECIKECSAQGPVDDAVEYWVKESKLTTDFERDNAISFLKEYGAWSLDELSALDDQGLAEKCLWLYCCDIKENPQDFENIVSEIVDTIEIPNVK